MSDKKSESWWSLIAGGIFGAVLFAALFLILLGGSFFLIRLIEFPKDVVKMAPVGKADVFSINSPMESNDVIVFRAKIGNSFYVIVQSKNGVAICPEPTLLSSRYGLEGP